MNDSRALLRIGELSRRTGVPPELLRAWERRYGLVRPARSPGGYRLYTLEDVDRIRAMRAHLDSGLSAAQAARLAAAGPPPAEPGAGEERAEAARRELAAALDGFADGDAHAALDRQLAALSADAVIGEIVLPVLRELGERWEGGEVSVAEEHFASNLLRERLLGLARGWDGSAGPRAVLACPPGELHDLGLVCFAVALRERGWRVTFLGADTPLATLAETAGSLRPRLVVLSAVDSERFAAVAGELGGLAREHEVALAGAGATEALAAATGARLLPSDPIAEAARLTRELATAPRAAREARPGRPSPPGGGGAG